MANTFTPAQALAEFITLAAADPNIQAIGTEGSTNDLAMPADDWADLDITLFATDAEQVDGPAWLRHFGAPIITEALQERGLFGGHELWFSWLTRFAGTARIDLKAAPIAAIADYLADDTLNAIVWQREQGQVTPRSTSAASHGFILPDQATLNAHVTEFYWVAGYVVKGLARGNLLYANQLLDHNVRPELLYVAAAEIAAHITPFFDAGVDDKNVWTASTPAFQTALAATYRQDSLAATKDALAKTVALYGQVLRQAASALHLTVPDQQRAIQQLHEWLA